MKSLLRMLFGAVQGATAQLPNNDKLYTYTIRSASKGIDYMTRTLFPRVAGHRLLLHKIHIPDQDRHLHNHPWESATSLILSGGYLEERLVEDDKILRRAFLPGDTNRLDSSTFHRITHVEPNTWTAMLVGERVQDWGFLVDGEVVQWQKYLGIEYTVGGPKS